MNGGHGRGTGHRPARNTFVLSGRSRSFQHRSTGAGYVPLWYGDPYGYGQADSEPATNAPVSPIIVSVQPQQAPPPAREVPAAKPLVIDVPSAVDSAAAKPLPPAIFILATGQRLEAQRYMLTAEKLYVTIDRRQLTFPLASLDLDRTIAANRDRAVNLRIPAERSEISLGF